MITDGDLPGLGACRNRAGSSACQLYDIGTRRWRTGSRAWPGLNRHFHERSVPRIALRSPACARSGPRRGRHSRRPASPAAPAGRLIGSGPGKRGRCTDMPPGSLQKSGSNRPPAVRSIAASWPREVRCLLCSGTVCQPACRIMPRSRSMMPLCGKRGCCFASRLPSTSRDIPSVQGFILCPQQTVGTLTGFFSNTLR